MNSKKKEKVQYTDFVNAYKKEVGACKKIILLLCFHLYLLITHAITGNVVSHSTLSLFKVANDMEEPLPYNGSSGLLNNAFSSVFTYSNSFRNSTPISANRLPQVLGKHECMRKCIPHNSIYGHNRVRKEEVSETTPYLGSAR